MAFKIWDFEKPIFRLTLIAIAVVFLLNNPSVSIIASWYPGKTDTYWFLPGFLFANGVLAWVVYRISLPALIQKGILADRRMGRREMPLAGARDRDVHAADGGMASSPLPMRQRLWRWWLPLLRLLFQTFFAAALTAWTLAWMHGGGFGKYFVNIPGHQP